jgi:hypothetical protein
MSAESATKRCRPAIAAHYPSGPWPTQRRGLSRIEAAFYLGISPSKFDELRKGWTRWSCTAD